MVRHIARSLVKAAGIVFLAVFLPVLLFLGAAGIGAFVPRANLLMVEKPKAGRIVNQSEESVTIFLVTSLLHADIAIPYSPKLLDEFPQFAETLLPLENPQLEYLGFGWGSKAFYTTAGTYKDIRFSTAITAITGDDAVMRVVGLPDLQANKNIVPLVLEGWQYRLLIENLKAGFIGSETGELKYLPGFSIGFGDAFFAGVGDFNIFNPCNQWAGEVLSKSGLKVGAFTPTTYSLLWSLEWNGELQDRI